MSEGGGSPLSWSFNGRFQSSHCPLMDTPHGNPVGKVAVLWLGLDPWFSFRVPGVRVMPSSGPGTGPPPSLEALKPASVGRGSRQSHGCL